MTVERPTLVELAPPPWMVELEGRLGEPFPALKARLSLVIELARRNVAEGTGGPFGAAVFETATGCLVSVGVNRVEALRLSIAHAEVMALSAAQSRLRSYDLASPVQHELVSSAQPCAMCLGAVLWSGVTRLVYAATRGDVESIVGFDEGPVSPRWRSEFRRRGIEVLAARERARALPALRLYRDGNGVLYAGRRSACGDRKNTAEGRSAKSRSRRSRTSSG